MNGQAEDADAETKPNGQAEEEEGATTGETKEGATTADQDVVLIQDTGFNIKIQAPGMDPFDLPVSLSFLFDCYLFGLCFNAKVTSVSQNLPPHFLGNLPMWRYFFLEKFKFYLLGDILRGYLKVKSEKIVLIILAHSSLSICSCKFTVHNFADNRSLYNVLTLKSLWPSEKKVNVEEQYYEEKERVMGSYLVTFSWHCQRR